MSIGEFGPLRDNMGAVTAGHEVTCEAAISVLRSGGNAFDAIIAGLCAACVAEPVLAALGGGGFMMAHDGKKTKLYDFFCDTPRVKKPISAIEFDEVWVDFGKTKQAFHVGAGASATPGMVPGLQAIHRTYGTMPMADLTEFAISAARSGVTVTPFQAYLSEVVGPILLWSEDARAIFAPTGTLLKAGDVQKNPDLADALDCVAGDKLDPITSAMVEESLAHGGQLGQADFDAYQVAVREPLSLVLNTNDGDVDIWLNPAPAMGGILTAGMLQFLSQREAADAIATRAGAMADIDRLWRVSGSDVAERLGFSPNPHDLVVQRGTTHISVVDSFGQAASATVSNGEGNGRVVPGFGFMLNNMLGEADLNPDGFQHWQPGRRLSSMMTPTLAKRADGTLIALGSGGSNRIRTAVFQVLANLVLEGETPESAVDKARLHFENNVLDIEGDNDPAESQMLADVFPGARTWDNKSLYFGGVHVAMAGSDGSVFGAGDKRRSGVFRAA